MTDLYEYFAHHITLVIDNDQSAYNAINEQIRDAIAGEDDEMTISGYLALSEGERFDKFGKAIGEAVLAHVCAWMQEVIGEYGGGIGSTLLKEIMPDESSYSLAYALGKHYLPEAGQATEFFDEDEAEEEDDE